MSKTPEQIIDEIYDEFNDTTYDGITATEEILTEIIGKNVNHNDSRIYDGCTYDDEEDYDDEEKDDYIMEDSFSTDDGEFEIYITYGDVTCKIGDVEIKHNPLPEPEPKSIFNVICLYSYDYEDYPPVVLTCTSKEIALKKLKEDFEWHKSETYLKTYFDENGNIIEDEVDEFSFEDDKISIYDGAKPFKFDIYIEENVLYEN